MKRTWPILLGLLVLTAPAAVQAQVVGQVDGFYYEEYAGTNTITGYYGSGGVVNIPANINGLPVASIGYAAFEGCVGLTGVTIDNGVISIADFAFIACSNLTSVTIPGSVTSIGSNAFVDCTSLTSVTVPGSVTSIGYAAFEGCVGLAGVTIDNGVTSIGDYAFVYCFSLTSVYFEGNAPAVGTGVFSGDNNATIYYLAGTTGWTNPFAGLPAVMLNQPVQNGSLQVTIIPAAAITAGAQWQVDGGTNQNSGATVSNLSVGNHRVSFSTIGGWVTPASQTVTVNSNQTTTATGIYAVEVTPPGVSGCALFSNPTDTISVNGHTVSTNQMTIEAEILIPSSLAAPTYPVPRIFEEQLCSGKDNQLFASPDVIGGETWISDNPNIGVTASNPGSKDSWYHIAFVHDFNEDRVYLDGIEAGTHDFTGDPGIANAAGGIMALGAAPYTCGPVAESFIGAIQWVRVSPVARYSGASVVPPATVPAPDAFTQVLFDFRNVAPGTSVVYDLSPNHFSGTVGVGFSGATAPTFVPPAPPMFQTASQMNQILTLSWSAVAGLIYQLQYSTNLAQAQWSSLGYPIVATSGIITVSDTIGPDTQRFYRVVESR